jgi:hypothetical protein
MINFLIKIFLIIFIQLFPVNSFADSIDNDMANAYAEFIDLLNQNIIGIKKGRFCIFGSDEISNAILLRNKDYLRIEEDMKNVELCNLVYIANDRQKSFKFIGKKFTENKIVTIANYSGFAINDNGLIEIQLGRRNFELIINKKSLKVNGLKLNPLIHSLVIN